MRLTDQAPELRATLLRMLADPADAAIPDAALRLAITDLRPKLLLKLASWQMWVSPTPENRRRFLRLRRIGTGRNYRLSVLPKVTAARTVEFGDGLSLRFIEDHPAAEQFMRFVMPKGTVHEPALVEHLRRSVRPGDVIVDVGAHVGYVACVAAALGATVFAVEMQPTLIPMIQLNAALNDLWRIHPLCAAVGDRSGLVPIMRASPTPGSQASIAPWERNDFPLASLNHDWVPCLTLDGLFERMPAPSLVKIDIEGAEGLALAGARTVIASGETRFLVEIHAHRIADYGSTLADILAPFDAERWTLSLLGPDGPVPLSHADFLDPAGPIAAHAHNAPVLFEPRRR